MQKKGVEYIVEKGEKEKKKNVNSKIWWCVCICVYIIPWTKFYRIK